MVLGNDPLKWRAWKRDVLGYFDSITRGMKAYLLEVERNPSYIDEAWVEEQAVARGNWAREDKEQLWRALNSLTVDEPKKIIEATPDDGWNGWRLLCQYFNPSLASMEGRAWSELGMLAQNTAKSPEETKRLMNELAVRIKNVEDISGEAVADTHAKSILLTFMDPITRQHTVAFHGKQSDYMKLKQECLQFINNTVGNGREPMQLGSCQNPFGVPEFAPEEWDWEADDNLNALGKSGCYICGAKGHYARECTAKGKGKGKGKNNFKGDFGKGVSWNSDKGKGKGGGKSELKGGKAESKGKGKGVGNYGPLKGCWTCGGPHYAQDCPHGQSGGTRSLEEWWPADIALGQIKRLSALKTVDPKPTNSFHAFMDDEESDLESEMEPADPIKHKQEEHKNDKQKSASFLRQKNVYRRETPELCGGLCCGGGGFQKCEGQESIKIKPKSIDESWAEIIYRQQQRVVIPDDVAKKWDEIRSRHVERDRPWEVLEKTIPGYFVPRVRRRREVQEGYRLWASNIWKGCEYSKCKAICCEKKMEKIGIHESHAEDQMVPISLEAKEDFESFEKNKIVNIIQQSEFMKILPQCTTKSNVESYYEDFRIRNIENLNILETVEPEGINTLEDPEWEEIELAVDSGATETVIGEEALKSVKLLEGSAFKRGVQYEVANGIRIQNLGEKKFIGWTSEGLGREITAQVCEVNKALLSVSKIVAAGNRVVFDPEGSYIEDMNSGEKVWMKSQGGMYMIKMWVQRSF